jgi:CRISPR-associated protein Cas7/Csh2, subtype I-B/HMARI
MSESTITSTDLQHRSEIIFLYDAERANPNGDPLSGNDMPRVDKQTGQAIVTEVRLKRFLRDQMTDDDRGVYLLNPEKQNKQAMTRDALFKQVMGYESAEEFDSEELFDTMKVFLSRATDARMFGAPLSLSGDVEDQLGDNQSFPSFTGPIQFGHGESLHEVVPNTESRQLSPTIATEESDTQGTFAEDNRLQYALVRFAGVINENNASNTGLSQDDVKYLDRLCWRAIKSQTNTRSKQGHTPRLYLRVEFDHGYHVGDLKHTIEIDRERSPDDKQLRNIGDVTLDVSKLLAVLGGQADNSAEEESASPATSHLQKINICASQYLTVSTKENVGGAQFLYKQLKKRTDQDVDLNIIDVYGEDT